MDKFDRIQLLHRIFKSKKGVVSNVELAQQLECSPKTVQRSIEQMRDYLNAPIEYDRDRHDFLRLDMIVDAEHFPPAGAWIETTLMRSKKT